MATHYAPMKVEFINPFVTSAVTVFRKMLQCDLTRGEIYLKGHFQPDHEMSGVIGLSGGAIGTVVLSLSRAVAISATETMLGERPETLNSDVVDAIGEITNMIAGSAKADLEQFAMTLSLPNVIIGKNHTVTFPSGITPISIPFSCEWGSVCLDVGLCEVPELVAT